MTNYWKWLPWLSSSKCASVSNGGVIPLNEREVLRFTRDKTVLIEQHESFYRHYVQYMTTQILRDLRQEMELDSYGGNYENIKYNKEGAAWFEVQVMHILPKDLKNSVKEAIGKHGYFVEVLDVQNPHDATETETLIKVFLTVGELAR